VCPGGAGVDATELKSTGGSPQRAPASPAANQINQSHVDLLVTIRDDQDRDDDASRATDRGAAPANLRHPPADESTTAGTNTHTHGVHRRIRRIASPMGTPMGEEPNP